MVIRLMTIIERREIEALLSTKWSLWYGRRKTGKTFYAREKLKYSHYFIVTHGRDIINIETGETLSFNEFLKVFPLLIGSGRIVVDEFHRLDEPFFSLIQGLSGKGELTLITSTRHYFRRFIGANSPLLGLLHPIEVGLVDPRDALKFMNSLGFKGGSLVELAVLVQEPWLAPSVESLGEGIFKGLGWILQTYVPSLVGEIFNEEERELTHRYSAILESVANGKRTATEIAKEMFSRGLIQKETHGAVAPYLDTLVGMGLLRRVRVYGRKRKTYHYQHVSPVVDFTYYLNSKYGFLETGLPEETVERLFQERLPKYVESFFERLLSKHYALQPVRIEKPNLELDVALLRNKKLYLVAEVKWREKIREKDIRKAENKFDEAGGRINLLIVPDKESLPREPENAKVFDWRDALALS